MPKEVTGKAKHRGQAVGWLRQISIGFEAYFVRHTIKMKYDENFSPLFYEGEDLHPPLTKANADDNV